MEKYEIKKLKGIKNKIIDVSNRILTSIDEVENIVSWIPDLQSNVKPIIRKMYKTYDKLGKEIRNIHDMLDGGK